MDLAKKKLAETYDLSPFPGLHGHFVLFELVTPVRVDLLVVVRLAGRGAALRVHRDVVAAQRVGAEAAVVAAGLGLGHAHDHQSLLGRLDVLVRPVA